MLRANGKNMQNDILISGGVLAGVLFTRLLGLPVLDAIVALAISAWIVRTAFTIFMESNMELMDGLGEGGGQRNAGVGAVQREEGPRDGVRNGANMATCLGSAITLCLRPERRSETFTP